MRLTAVVPTTDAAPTLEVALAAIAAADEGPDEVVVVMGGDAIAPVDDGVVVVRSAAHGGPAAARNAGAAAAAGDVIVFVDADVAVRDDAFARIRAAFTDGEVDAVFGSYCDSPAAGGVVSGFRNLLHHHVHQGGAGRAETFWTGLGAVRRDVLLRAGGLDDELRYLEDIELGRRLVRSGARIELDPELQGTHLKGYTLRSMVRTDLRERSIPWLRLALEQRVSARALNAAPRHRASALASAAMPAGAVAGSPALVGGAAAAMVALNLRLYLLVARRLGWRGGVLGLPLHVLHHLTALCGVAPALAQHALGRPRPRAQLPARTVAREAREG